MKDRKIAFALVVLALVGASSLHRPSLNIDLAQEAAAVAPIQAQAAMDLGLLGVSVLVTWGVDGLR